MSTECEILALDIALPDCSPFTLFNLYFPAGGQDTRCVDRILASGRKDIVLAGEFNSHHVSWGSKTVSEGKRLWEWSLDNNLSCLNLKAATFVRGQSQSAIDLTFSSSFLTISSWDIIDCATKSHHLPITFETDLPVISLIRKNNTFVNYDKLQKDFKSTMLSPTDMRDVRAMSLCAVLKLSVKNAAGILTCNTCKLLSPWWNSECARAHRKRNAAGKQLHCNQCPNNWSDYQFVAASF